MTSPFRSMATGAAFFSESHAGAAEMKLGYAWDHRLEAALIVGESGLGKTTLLRRFANRLAADGHSVVDLFFARLDVDGLLAFIHQELEGPAEAIGRESRLRWIAQRARELSHDDRGLAILVDDAHLLRDAEIFEAMHMLLNLRDREGARLTIVLAGQRALLADLGQVPAFAQRISVTATLAPLAADQTASYIRHLLRAADLDDRLFEDEAIESIHNRSIGIPRTINCLCEMALIMAQADGRSSISRRDIELLTPEFPVFCRDAA